MGTVFDMGRILLLVISTALAAPQGNYSDYSDITMDDVILERSAISDRAINTCGCAPVSSTNRIVGGKEVSPKGKLPYQVMFYPCTPEGMCGLCEEPSSTRSLSSLPPTAGTRGSPTSG